MEDNHIIEEDKGHEEEVGGMSPFVIEVEWHRVHITLFANPFMLSWGLANASLSPDDTPKRCSHQVIQIYFSFRIFKQYKMNLLIKDDTLYNVALRRHVLNLSDEHKAKGIKL